jgi:hypothetical protein
MAGKSFRAMFQGRYTRWNPVPAFEDQRLSCEALHDDWEGFRIWLKPPSGSMLIVAFPSVLFHASSDDGARLSAIANTAPLDLPHAFWTVEASALIAEFHRQSCDTRRGWNITHFAFLTTNDCIDVLSTEAPVFRVHE